MPKTTDEVVTAQAAPITSSLTEFCMRVSQTVRRPELIGAFEHVERTAGRTTDTEAAYRARFDAFLNKPI